MNKSKELINSIRKILDSSTNRDLVSAYQYMCNHIEKQIDEGKISQAEKNTQHLIRDVTADARNGYLNMIPEVMKNLLNE